MIWDYYLVVHYIVINLSLSAHCDQVHYYREYDSFILYIIAFWLSVWSDRGSTDSMFCGLPGSIYTWYIERSLEQTLDTDVTAQRLDDMNVRLLSMENRIGRLEKEIQLLKSDNNDLDSKVELKDAQADVSFILLEQAELSERYLATQSFLSQKYKIYTT